jgi:hypothetical protein
MIILPNVGFMLAAGGIARDMERLAATGYIK